MEAVKHSYLDAQTNHGYVFMKHETRFLSGTTAKPDGVIYYGNHAKKDLTSVHVLIVAKVKEYADGPLLDNMRKLLFEKDGVFIGGNLLSRKGTFRDEKRDELGEILGSDIKKRCIVELPEATGSVDNR
ncbi:hypothetical protein LPJ53_004368, partial [Coemansia erecta]